MRAGPKIFLEARPWRPPRHPNKPNSQFVGGTVRAVRETLAFLKHRETPEDTEKRLTPTQFLCELCVLKLRWWLQARQSELF